MHYSYYCLHTFRLSEKLSISSKLFAKTNLPTFEKTPLQSILHWMQLNQKKFLGLQ